MSYDPYSFIIGQIVKGAARNMKETEQYGKASEQNALRGRIQGNESASNPIVYQQAPEIKSTAVSPTAQITAAATGLSVDQQKQVPTVGDALRGEESNLRNVTPAVGGYADPRAAKFDYEDIMSKLYGKYSGSYRGGY